MKRTFTNLLFSLLAVLISLPLQAQDAGMRKISTRPSLQTDPLSTRKLTKDDRVEMLEWQGIESQVQLDGARTSACAAAAIMNTPYNSNNGQRGCMFDVFAANAVTIRCFEANLYAGTTANYEIYYRAGTHVGFENNAAAWTFLGGATGITSAGNNMPTALPIPVNVSIPAGATYSFYITNDFGGGTSYTDGAAVGNFLAADANLTVFEGVGKSYPFGLTFAVRNFNGHIFYDMAGPLDAEDALLEATAEAEGVALDWQVGQHQQPETMVMERSQDGEHFAELARLDGAAPVASLLDRDVVDGRRYYYRLRMTTPNGQAVYSNIVEAAFEAPAAFEVLDIGPNPFAEQIHLQLRNHAASHLHLQLSNQLGQRVYEQDLVLTPGLHDLQVQPGNLPAGLYYLQLNGGGAQQVTRILRQ